jgi:hypothetical protein
MKKKISGAVAAVAMGFAIGMIAPNSLYAQC